MDGQAPRKRQRPGVPRKRAGERASAQGERRGKKRPQATGPQNGDKRPTIRADGDRRDRSKARLQTRPRKPSDDTARIPATFTWMALAYAVAGIAAFLLVWRFPLPLTLGAMTGAVAAAALVHFAIRWEHEAERNERVAFAVSTVAIGLPSLIFGTGLAYSVFVGRMDPVFGAGALISLSAVAAVLLSGRPVGLVQWKVAFCVPFVVLSNNPVAYVALVLFIALCIAVARYQNRIDREKAERNMADARVRNRAIDILREYENTKQGWFWETDRRGQLTYLSEPIAQLLGKSPKKLLGRPILDLFDLSYENREGERTINFHLSARSAFQELAVRANIRARDEHDERWWSISGRPVYDSFQNFCGFRGSGTDLTEKKRSQEHASRLAHFDSLTGLANRFQMSQSLDRILSAPQERNRECSVFLLDLDRFKHVNDTLGHPAGDALLKQVAQRLESTVGDTGRVGRLGGDEFQVILPGRNPQEKLGHLAGEIIRSLSQPYSIEGQRVVIGASVGIAICPDHATDLDLLIRNADLALYAAKDGGRGRYHFYSKDLHSAAEERNKLEQDLRDALASEELDLHYQPVVECASETISGFEALIRWPHPELGMISPERFVPIAEDTGLIQEMGAWALRRACADLAQWPENVRCAVNVSPLQFANAALPATIEKAIADAGIAPARLELEITESVFLTDDEGTDAMFAALKKIGVRLALDDFGTGYSSLGYLKTAPFDKIKIDQSFVRGATQPGSRNGAIIASITSLALALGMDTTAEGVETLDELDLVRMHGCSHIQGYIYDKPLSFADASERLRLGLKALAKGPRSSRAPRQTMLRKIVLENGGQYYNGTVRNISATGALVEGLWNVPPGTHFHLALSEKLLVSATSRWSKKDRMGVEFAERLETDEKGMVVGLSNETQFAVSPGIRKSA